MRIFALSVALFAFSCAGGSSKDPEPVPNPVTLTLADLHEISDATYPVEEGATISVVFTNFCEQPTQFGFSPDEGGPPIVWTIQPRQRQRIEIPKTYSLRGRVEGERGWPETGCTAKNNHHLTFNVDCETCTSGKDDPLERKTCVEAGTCLDSE